MAQTNVPAASNNVIAHSQKWNYSNGKDSSRNSTAYGSNRTPNAHSNLLANKRSQRMQAGGWAAQRFGSPHQTN